MNETELYRRCQLFAEMLGNACGLGVWAFGPDKKLYMSSCAHEREFQLFLRAGNCLDRALTEADISVFFPDRIPLWYPVLFPDLS